MAKRPENTRLENVFNPGIDKRLPVGFVDQVIDKKTGDIVGFVKDGTFYNLGDKVVDKSKTKNKAKTENKSAETSNNLEEKINYARVNLKTIKSTISSTKVGTPRYKELVEQYNSAQIRLNNLNNQYDDLKSIENNINTVDAAKKKTGTLKNQIKSLEESKTRAVDLGLDTKDIDDQIEKFKSDLTQARTVVKTTDVTPNYKEPGLTPENKGPQGDKKIIDAEVAAKGITPKATITPTPTQKPSTSNTPKVPTEKTASELEDEALNVAAGSDFALPETLFKNIPSLNALLKRYVDEKWTPDKLRKAIRDDVWYKQNSGEIKARYVQYYNYRDLQASGRATGSTDYEMQIDKIEAKLKKRAVEIGSAAASDPAALRKAAENLYITNRSEDQSFIDDFLAASIRKIGGTIGGKGTEGYSGQALANYQELLKTARDNGLKVSDIIPGGFNEQQVLSGIASGKLDINRIIQDTRKLASQGQPQYVRDLLSQGYNLNQVFAPYRQTMAAVLEIDDPNSIDLNDPLLRSAISDKGDMNIYEFKKALRKDNRWQYTEQARQDVSSATLDILRDFGFQG